MARAWCVVLFAAVGCASSPPPAPAVASAPPHTSAAPPVQRCSAAASQARALARDAEQLALVDAQGAIDTLKRAAALEPGNDAIQAQLSAAFAKADHVDDAIASAREAARLNPARASHWRHLAVLLGRRAAGSHGASDWSAVRDAAARCTALAADDAECLELEGRASAALGDDQRALTALTRAIARDPSRLEAYFELADHYLVLADTPRALAVLDACERRAQGDDERVYVLNVLRFHAYQAEDKKDGMLRAAEAAYQAGHERHPEVAFNLGATCAVQEPPRSDEARRALLEFMKRVCRGAAAARFRDQCETSSALLQKLGGP